METIGKICSHERNTGLTRQWLHAWKLAFTLFGKEYEFEGPIKDDLTKCIE